MKKRHRILEWTCVLMVLAGTGIAAPKMFPGVTQPPSLLLSWWDVWCSATSNRGWSCGINSLPDPPIKALEPTEDPAPCPPPPTCDPSIQSCPGSEGN